MASSIDNSRPGGVPSAARATTPAGSRDVVPAPESAETEAVRRRLREELAELDLAAIVIGSVALTFFSAIALACTAGFVAGLLGLLGHAPDTGAGVARIADAIAPPGAGNAVGSAADDLARHKGLAFALCVLALLAAATAGAAFVRVFRWTLAMDVQPGTSSAVWVAALPAVLVATLLGCAVAAAVLLTGPVAHAVADSAGFGDLTLHLWNVFKWPLAALSYLLLLGALSAQMRADRLAEPAWAAASRWGALFAWVFALAGLGYYIGAFGSFSDNYGVGWAAALSLLWLALFGMLLLALPLRRSGRSRPLALASAVALAFWVPASVAMAVLVANVGPLSGVLAATVLVTAVPLWLWCCNLGLLAGAAVRRRLELGELGPVAHTGQTLGVAAESGRQADVEHAVAVALEDDDAQEAVLSVIPPAPGTPAGGLLTELERDVADWGFTYGVAWSTARARHPDEPDEAVAQRALAAAREVFGLYMGDAEWAERIRAEREREARRDKRDDTPPPPPANRSSDGKSHGTNGSSEAPAKLGELL